MTDTPATPTATPAASNASPAAAPAAATPATPATPTPAAVDTPAATSTDTPAPDTNSGKDAPAQDADQPNTDKADQPNQSSDEPKTEDADKTDTEGKDAEDGDKDAQPAYEPFTMPEGMELDQAALDEVLPILQEHKVPQEAAQKLMDTAAAMLSKATKTMIDQHNDVVNGWRKETTELFGKDGEAKFEERKGKANEAIKAFFTPEQVETVNHYGLGNHPAFFKMCLAIAEGMGEDRPNLPSAGNGMKAEETLAAGWYGNTQS